MWVFEPNICLAVPVRVVSVAAGLGRGHSRIVSPAEPSGEPLGRRVPLAYVSSERISGALRSLALPPIPRVAALARGHRRRYRLSHRPPIVVLRPPACSG